MYYLELDIIDVISWFQKKIILRSLIKHNYIIKNKQKSSFTRVALKIELSSKQYKISLEKSSSAGTQPNYNSNQSSFRQLTIT